MATQKNSARAKKLDRIMARIALFAVQETYTDEPEAQEALGHAIEKLEEAQAHLKETAE